MNRMNEFVLTKIVDDVEHTLDNQQRKIKACDPLRYDDKNVAKTLIKFVYS